MNSNQLSCKNGNKATLVCVDSNCPDYPLVCNSEECPCSAHIGKCEAFKSYQNMVSTIYDKADFKSAPKLKQYFDLMIQHYEETIKLLQIEKMALSAEMNDYLLSKEQSTLLQNFRESRPQDIDPKLLKQVCCSQTKIQPNLYEMYTYHDQYLNELKELTGELLERLKQMSTPTFIQQYQNRRGDQLALKEMLKQNCRIIQVEGKVVGDLQQIDCRRISGLTFKKYNKGEFQNITRRCTNIQLLSLSGCNISDIQIIDICKQLKYLPKLRELGVARNRIKDLGAECLVESIENRPIFIDIKENKLSDKIKVSISDKLNRCYV